MNNLHFCIKMMTDVSYKISKRYIALLNNPAIKQNLNYIYYKPKKEEYSNILKLMEKTYCKDEPTFKSLNIKNPTQFLYLASKYIGEGHSYVAKCNYPNCTFSKNNGDIVGAIVAIEYKKNKNSLRASYLQDVRYKSWLMLDDYSETCINLFKLYNVEKIFQLEFAFIQKEYRKINLGKNLTIHALNWAQESGYKIASAVTTNSYSAAACETLNFKKVMEIPFSNLFVKNNKPLFNTGDIHKMLKIYTREL